MNECQLGIDVCVDNAECSDTEGSYECTCSNAYSRDGSVNCDSESLQKYTSMFSMYMQANMCNLTSDSIYTFSCHLFLM